ncbi:hypothetical protein [Mycobacterium nebraskense]|uniref:hypothetical protein n=1 Tax=Mycobacterium nebraskense TaxID=244292 RepID=UPI0023F4336E|nr:hypothetical protein [Mycobacterium nebraskense]MBI2692772.1 hypothetical protein [Mycobacterium nebraskense]
MAETMHTTTSQSLTHLFGPSLLTAESLPPQPALADPLQPDLSELALSIIDVEVLIHGTEAEVQRHVLDIVATGLRRPLAEITGEDYIDGTDVDLDSMTAVYACRLIADRLGAQMRPPRGNCRPNDFVSIGSVARLVCRLRREAVTL